MCNYSRNSGAFEAICYVSHPDRPARRLANDPRGSVFFLAPSRPDICLLFCDDVASQWTLKFVSNSLGCCSSPATFTCKRFFSSLFFFTADLSLFDKKGNTKRKESSRFSRIDALLPLPRDPACRLGAMRSSSIAPSTGRARRRRPNKRFTRKSTHKTKSVTQRLANR